MKVFQGLEGMVALIIIAEEVRVSFLGGGGGDGNVLKLDVVMVARL